ncbi:MAG: hypothetical protein V3T55_12145 [Anaerolineales bacterium]
MRSIKAVSIVEREPHARGPEVARFHPLRAPGPPRRDYPTSGTIAPCREQAPDRHFTFPGPARAPLQAAIFRLTATRPSPRVAFLWAAPPPSAQDKHFDAASTDSRLTQCKRSFCSGWCRSARDEQEQLLVGIVRGEQEAETPGIAHDNGTDFEQREANGDALRAGELGAM